MDEGAGEIAAKRFDRGEHPEVTTIAQFLAMVTKEAAWRISVQDLLGLFGYTYMTTGAVAGISRRIKLAELSVEPDLASADRYGSVLVYDPRSALERRIANGLPISSVNAIGELVWLSPSDSVSKARTLMVMHKFSQVPVLANQRRDLRGTVTWRSLAEAPNAATVAQAMVVGGQVVDSSDDLADLVASIVSNEFIYYRNPEKVIVGIVTASDLAVAFYGTTGFFIQLREIEARLRNLLDQVPIPALRRHVNPDIPRGDRFLGAQDMTFQEYVNAVGDSEIWQTLQLPFDQKVFGASLEAARGVRNDVAHFRAPERDASESVAQCLNLLRSIESLQGRYGSRS